MQPWFLVTPVIYPASLVPAKWRLLLAFNPMVGFIDAFRAACFGRPIDGVGLAISVVVTVAFLMLAARTFLKIEPTCADQRGSIAPTLDIRQPFQVEVEYWALQAGTR